MISWTWTCRHCGSTKAIRPDQTFLCAACKYALEKAVQESALKRITQESRRNRAEYMSW